MTPINILIFGATGHLGSELVKACQARGHHIHAWVRPASHGDGAKMKPLRAAGATIHQGELDDYDRLLSVCKAVDCVLSALDVTSADEGTLAGAVKDAGVQRFILSGFGIDPAVAAPRSCAVFDLKSAVQRSVKEAGISYAFVHANGFFSPWVFTLGDMTKLEGELPPAETSVYGDGNIKGSFVSVPDVAAVTVRAVHDPRLEDKEIRIDTNRMTQNELVELWQDIERQIGEEGLGGGARSRTDHRRRPGS